MSRPTSINPLAVSFGSALKKYRGTRIFDDLPGAGNSITSNYYRLIESGQNHPSVAKAMALSRLFEPDVSYESVAKFLAVISGSEEDKQTIPEERAAKLHQNVAEIYNSLKKGNALAAVLGAFLRPLRDFPSISSYQLPSSAGGRSILELATSPDTIRELIQLLKLDDKVYQFLSATRASFAVGETPLATFFDPIPSVYKWMFDGLRESVEQLPTTFGAETSWQWESKNAKSLRLFVGVGYREHITSQENLQRYQFDYLWEPEFGHASFVLLDEDGKSEAFSKKEFWHNLKDSLSNSGDSIVKSRVDSVDKMKLKTTFIKTTDMQREVIDEILQSVGGRAQGPLNSIWFFTTHDGAIISAVSAIDPETKKATTIEFLSFGVGLQIAKKLDGLFEDRNLFPEFGGQDE